mmetsp:Transcript_2906/g.9840  ORF Transcript_2906/g.9840 Transcript_2906/m.9840 type:complete len:211 (-) Transcript_2906:1715-2347(-)
MDRPCLEAACISRAATLTRAPLSVYSRRKCEPASQQKTFPVVMPVAQPSRRWRTAEPSPLSAESASVVVLVRVESRPPARVQETRCPRPRGKLAGSPVRVMRGSVAEISSAASTARASSSSCARPGRPKAMRKRVPLSSVMTRVSVPPCRCTFSCTTATAAWHSIRLSTSQLRAPSPSTLRKTETSFRCSDAYKPSSCPACTLSQMSSGT